MTCPSEHPTPERIQQVAQQTFQAIKKQDSFWASLLRDRNDLHRAIAECVKMVGGIEPAQFTEREFAQLVSALGSVIDALERHFTKHGNHHDVAQCYFLGHALSSLKDARHWIAQGLPPDSSKRPSEADRLVSAKARAATVWAEIIA